MPDLHTVYAYTTMRDDMPRLLLPFLSSSLVDDGSIRLYRRGSRLRLAYVACGDAQRLPAAGTAATRLYATAAVACTTFRCRFLRAISHWCVLVRVDRSSAILYFALCVPDAGLYAIAALHSPAGAIRYARAFLHPTKFHTRFYETRLRAVHTPSSPGTFAGRTRAA